MKRTTIPANLARRAFSADKCGQLGEVVLRGPECRLAEETAPTQKKLF